MYKFWVGQNEGVNYCEALPQLGFPPGWLVVLDYHADREHSLSTWGDWIEEQYQANSAMHRLEGTVELDAYAKVDNLTEWLYTELFGDYQAALDSSSRDDRDVALERDAVCYVLAKLTVMYGDPMHLRAMLDG